MKRPTRISDPKQPFPFQNGTYDRGWERSHRRNVRTREVRFGGLGDSNQHDKIALSAPDRTHDRRKQLSDLERNLLGWQAVRLLRTLHSRPNKPCHLRIESRPIRKS